MAGRKSLNKVSIVHEVNAIAFYFAENNFSEAFFFHCTTFKGSQNLESKKIYDEIIDLMEKLDRFIYFVMLNVTLPSLVFPKYIVCYYIYFTTDMGTDAFELPLPVW